MLARRLGQASPKLQLMGGVLGVQWSVSKVAPLNDQ